MAQGLMVAPENVKDSDEGRRPRELTFRPWDILLPVSIALWALGVSQVHGTALGQYGLPAALPIVFYVGLGALVVSIGRHLAQPQLSPIRLTAHLATLNVMLFGTAPLVYAEGRYSWLYKYIGVAQYINLHGHLNQHIDIYQNWPGVFALLAWFDKAVGVQSPLAYAKWAQLAFELLSCLMLSFVFRALPLTARERWLALFIYASAIWIAQDYLSAQALGVVLSMGIFGLVLTYLSRNEDTKLLARLRKRFQPIGNLVRRVADRISPRGGERFEEDQMLLGATKAPGRQDAVVLSVLALVYFVLVFEHELSPYVVAIQLAGLAVIGAIRHRWIAVLLVVMVLGYLAPHFTFVNSQYGLTKSIGDFFGNVSPPKATVANASVSVGVHISERASGVLSLAMWALAAVGAWRRWRTGRPTLALLILAYSPVLVLLAGAYGNEGILRVYLFSLPWTACLAASALKPVTGARSKLGVLRAPVAITIILVLFFPSFFGNDYSYVMPKSEVEGVSAFYRTAPAGTIFAADDNFPSQLNGRYDLFVQKLLYGQDGILPLNKAYTEDGLGLTRAIDRQDPDLHEPVYVLISGSMQAYGTAYGFLHPGQLQKLSNTLSHTSGWFRIFHNQGLTVFELPPVA
jgi:hypothetical protein